MNSVLSGQAASGGHELSAIRLANFYVRDLTRSALRTLSRRVRTRQRVKAEYDEGSWRRLLERQPWIQFHDLFAFLVGEDTRSIVAKVDGRVIEIAANEYYRLRVAALVAAVGEHAPSDGQLIELGCGWGQNLFTLSLAHRQQHLAGFDISENGLRAARAIAAHFGLSHRVSFDSLDLTDAAHPNFTRLAGHTVFTCHCIEQVPDHVEKVIDNIRRNGPRRVIHMEPTAELLTLWRPMDFLNYMYVKSMHYQTRLFSTLAKLEKAGKIRILSQRRLSCAPTIHNDSFLAVWEPTGH